MDMEMFTETFENEILPHVEKLRDFEAQNNAGNAQAMEVSKGYDI
jgi:hypothetical protein